MTVPTLVILYYNSHGIDNPLKGNLFGRKKKIDLKAVPSFSVACVILVSNAANVKQLLLLRKLKLCFII